MSTNFCYQVRQVVPLRPGRRFTGNSSREIRCSSRRSDGPNRRRSGSPRELPGFPEVFPRFFQFRILRFSEGFLKIFSVGWRRVDPARFRAEGCDSHSAGGWMWWTCAPRRGLPGGDCHWLLWKNMTTNYVTSHHPWTFQKHAMKGGGTNRRGGKRERKRTRLRSRHV